MRGDVVIFPFPHTDLSTAKKRPAVVITQLSGVDVISCLITTQSNSHYAVEITSQNVKTGHLSRDCFARPDRLFTADTSKFIKTVCTLTDKKVDEIVEEIVKIIS